MTGIRLTGGKPLMCNGRPRMATISTVVPEMFVALNGQSNMVFLSTANSNYRSTDALVRRWADGGFHALGAYDPAGLVPPGTSYFGAGGWGSNTSMVGYTPQDFHSDHWGDGVVSFVNALAAATKKPLNIYEYAASGMPIETWLDDGTSNNWKRFATAAAGQKLNGTVWYQGESNLGNAISYYKGNLGTVHIQHVTFSGMAQADFYFGIVLLGPGVNFNSTDPESAARIRQAQLEYIRDTPGAYLIASAADMTLNAANDPSVGGDNQIHITNAAQLRMPARYAKSLALWQAGTPVKWPGPKISAANRIGLNVTVTTSGGTGALKDGAGGNGSAALGFRFFDGGANGAQIAYTAPSINGLNTIQLTLASAPVGSLTMDYGMAQAPFGVPTLLASCIYDSDTVPGDTTGLPLIPCAPIIVTVAGG